MPPLAVRNAIAIFTNMTDTLTPAARSARMALIRGCNTKPEMAIRRALHQRGYRYSLHRKDLPGKPDIVFPGRRKVIFAHGCFWHNHDCRIGHIPTSRTEYWEDKSKRNQHRDAENIRRLADLGWQSLVLWECEIKNLDKALDVAATFLAGVMLSEYKPGTGDECHS